MKPYWVRLIEEEPVRLQIDDVSLVAFPEMRLLATVRLSQHDALETALLEDDLFEVLARMRALEPGCSLADVMRALEGAGEAAAPARKRQTIAHDQDLEGWLVELLDAGLGLATLVEGQRDVLPMRMADGALETWTRAVLRARKAGPRRGEG